MIKNFGDYRKLEDLGNMTQWEKQYDDGTTARLAISNAGITRAMVIDAFAAQEAGVTIHCFTKNDIGSWY